MTIPDTPRNIFRYWHHLLLLSLESHCVIAMRTIKLAGGGFSALDEASRIMVEKVAATTDIPRVSVHKIASDADRDLSQAGQEQPAASCDAPLEQDRLIRSLHHPRAEHPDPLVAKIEREPASRTVEQHGRPERLRIDR